MPNSSPHSSAASAKLKLYHYWRSSSSWRVRTALAYKNIPYEAISVNLLNGESESEAHLQLHAGGAVPVLVTPTQDALIESLAIIQYLETAHPAPALVPADAVAKAKVWALAELINAGIHPIQNLPVLDYLSDDPAVRKRWAQHWITQGLKTFEKTCLLDAKKFSFGNSLTVADLCLVPQCYNARRFDVDLSQFPRILEIEQNCLALECFQKSHPDQFKPHDFVG